MTILLPALVVAFAAFCVWLTVRIVNRRERWAIWLAVATGLLIYIVTLVICIGGMPRLVSSPPSIGIED